MGVWANNLPLFDDDKIYEVKFTNDFVFIQFQLLIKILVGDQLQQRIQSLVLKLVRVDSRTRASKIASSTQKGIELVWIKFGSNQDGEEDFQEKTCVHICKFKIFVLR